MTFADVTRAVAAESRVLPTVGGRTRFLRMTERKATTYRTLWPILLSGLLEPFLYLLSIGLGVGALVGEIETNGRLVPYETFVASGMLATAAMNGAVIDTTFQFFIQLKYNKTYDGILATPLEPRDVALGEVAWALTRGAFYSTVFLATMAAFGLVESWWGLAALPTTVLIGAAFAAVGLTAATFFRSWLDFDVVNVAVISMLLFSATFFPLEEYPDWLAAVIEWTPLYQGVRLCRAFTLGDVDAGLLVPIAYLLAMTALGVAVSSRRLAARLRV